jgi:hypothetical protein
MQALSIRALVMMQQAAGALAPGGRLDPAVAALAVVAFPPVLAGAYLVKSALGINLLPGPSPLHDLLYHYVR